MSDTRPPNRLPSVLIIGAGVAGSVCAIRLRQWGVPVTIAEKDTFPRTKVCGCCLGGAGLKTLDRISQRDWVVDRGVTTTRWKSSIGDRLVELGLPDGIAISRGSLDTGLLGAARDGGANVLSQCRAGIDDLGHDDVEVTLQHRGEIRSQRFDLVVMAGGLNAAGLTQWLPWKGPPHGPFGASFHAEIDEIESGVIYMACDHDGYVGLVRLEDGRVDVAAALMSGGASAAAGTPRSRIDALLRRSQFGDLSIHQESRLMTTPPLRRSRPAGKGRLLVIGDAAGYVEPFTGEGMTWGAQSAIAAADLIAEETNLSRLGERWDQESRSLLRKKKLACRTITRALRSSMTRRVAGMVLNHWPSLAEPLIRDLNHL